MSRDPGHISSAPEPCPRCVELAGDVRLGRALLAALGRGPAGAAASAAAATHAEHDFARERALARWLSARPRGPAAAAYRAGWQAAIAQLTPQLREWQALWWQALAETNRLRARVGVLIQDAARAAERG